MATLSIFAYKGYVAATTDIENGKFMNDIHGGSQLGCVVDVKETEITSEAKKIIAGARREGGSFAPLMLTKHSNDDGASIGVMGFGIHNLGNAPTIGRVCDKCVLDLVTVNDEMVVPEGFKAAVDSI